MLIFTGINAQLSGNRFEEAEQSSFERNVEQENNEIPDIAKGPGNPGEDQLPIDDYIPVLVIIALGAIVYTTYRKKTLS